MPDQRPPSLRATLLRTAQGRIIISLLVVAFILGVALEVGQPTASIFNVWAARSKMRARTKPGPADVAPATPENCSVFERGSNKRLLCDIRERERQKPHNI
jgi:hypothetical protein